MFELKSCWVGSTIQNVYSKTLSTLIYVCEVSEVYVIIDVANSCMAATVIPSTPTPNLQGQNLLAPELCKTWYTWYMWPWSSRPVRLVKLADDTQSDYQAMQLCIGDSSLKTAQKAGAEMSRCHVNQNADHFLSDWRSLLASIALCTRYSQITHEILGK